MLEEDSRERLRVEATETDVERTLASNVQSSIGNHDTEDESNRQHPQQQSHQDLLQDILQTLLAKVAQEQSEDHASSNNLPTGKGDENENSTNLTVSGKVSRGTETDAKLHFMGSGRVDWHPSACHLHHGQMHLNYSYRGPGKRSKRSLRLQRNRIIFLLVITLLLLIIESTGSIMSHSLAVGMDAARLILDLTRYILAIFMIWMEGRPSGVKRLTFGWHRLEVVGAVYVILFLWFIVASFMYLSIRRVTSKHFDIEADILLITTGLAIVIKLLLYIRKTLCSRKRRRYGDKEGLHQGRHRQCVFNKFFRRRKKAPAPSPAPAPRNHEECVSRLNKYSWNHYDKCVQTVRTYTERGYPVHRISEANVPIVAYSLESSDQRNISLMRFYGLNDMLITLYVHIAGWFMFARPSWEMIDSFVTITMGIAVLILTVGLLMKALLILMESTPMYLDYEAVVNTFMSIQGVQSVHNLRIWAIGLQKTACVAHLDLKANANRSFILREATRLIHRRFKFFETTIQVDH